MKLFKSLKKNLLSFFYFISTSDNDSRKKLKRYIFLFVIVIILNIVVGKNITHMSYPWYSNVSMFLLLNINIILIILIILMIFRNLVKILSEKRGNLKRKMLLFSIFITVLPVGAIFIYSSQLINNSINSWFSRQVDEIVLSSEKMASDYRENEKNEFVKQLNFMNSLSQKYGLYDKLNINKYSDFFCEYVNSGIYTDLLVFDKNFDIILKCSHNNNNDFLIKLYTDNLNKIYELKNLYGFYSVKESYHWAGVYSDDNISGGIFATKFSTDNLYDNNGYMSKIYDNYNQNLYFLYPIKNSSIMQLLQISLLLLFASVWISAVFARSITKPIDELAKASIKISKGDFNVHVKDYSGGEVGALVNAFNSMINQISAHTNELNSKNQILSEMYDQILRDNLYIDFIFKNVDSSIILFSNKAEILKSNITADIFIGSYREEFDTTILSIIKDFTASKDVERVENIEISYKNGTKLYLMKMSKIALSSEEQILVMLGDVTDIVDAQKIELWKDIATKIAHEVKNPLTPIKLMAERVKRKSGQIDDVKLKSLIDESMDIIISEADNLKELIEEFNMFARTPKANKHELNLYELLVSTVSLYKETYRNVSININCDENVILNGDRLQLRRIFQNIISNAISIIGDADGIINIDVSEIGDKIKILISDNGPGIDEKDLNNIFKPYFSKRQGGTGLGLAIVKKIIEEHDGKITADNMENGGAVFTIVIPRGI